MKPWPASNSRTLLLHILPNGRVSLEIEALTSSEKWTVILLTGGLPQYWTMTLDEKLATSRCFAMGSMP